MLREAKQKKRIVVADDDDAILELVTIRLELAGFHVSGARTGVEALKRVKSFAPHGLVLDIGLPTIDGFDVLSALKRLGGNLPVLMLTARHSSSDIGRAMSLGARDFLAKPFDDKQLIERVSRLLEDQPKMRWTAI
jgi:two-component system OmpR family response regulator